VASFRSDLLRAPVLAGPGAAAGVHGWLGERGLCRPLLLAGAQVSRTPFFADLARSLGAAEAVSDLPSPATAQAVEALAGRHSDPKWDCLVAVGGGSTLDAAKATALLVACGGKVSDYGIRRFGPDGPRRPTHQHPIPPIIAVPTTFSGSEANINASIRDPLAGERYSIADPGLLPALVVLDPGALRSHRPEVLLGSAFNALAHCIEGIYSKKHHALADAQAGTAGRLIVSVLEEPERVMEEARLLQLQVASALAGALIREVYVGLHHAMCHAVVSLCNVLHAQANGAVLPWAVGFNARALASSDGERLRPVAGALALPERGAPDDIAAAVEARLRSLQRTCRIPARLSELGVASAQLPELVRYTLDDRALNTNPVAVDSEQLLALFERAL
jgi:alcohol dehydrogenase class IV